MSKLKLFQLWLEVTEELGISDPLLSDSCSGAQSLRIFEDKDITGEDLRTILAKIKSCLSDPKKKEKGAILLDHFLQGLDPSKLPGVQEPLLTSLRILCNSDKLIGRSKVVQLTLINFLPKCKSLPDILKELTPKNGIVSRILSACLEQLQESERELPSPEILNLLRMCLENFRGTCGPVRDKLERTLLPLLDNENGTLVRHICGLLPLLSGTGGGGSKGDGHSKDWLSMLRKLGYEADKAVGILYSDVCALESEEDNIFESHVAATELLLSEIGERQVFVKISKLKRRLCNLLEAIGNYLRKPFVAPKPVPAFSLLKLIGHVISINPIEILENPKQAERKEVAFLATILPEIHLYSFKLLDSLMKCLGSNLFPQAEAVEQLFTQQIRWFMKKNLAFVNLKQTTFRSLLTWVTSTSGHVTNKKSLKQWTDLFVQEIQLEKETVELRLAKSKNLKKNEHRSVAIMGGVSNFRSGLNYVQKSSGVCELALDILAALASTTESAEHKKIFSYLAKTHFQVYQHGTFPAQYVSSSCRMKLNKAIFDSCVKPHSKSNISLGLIISLLKRALHDPSPTVKHSCLQAICTLERIIHPSCQSMEFPQHITDLSTAGSSVDQTSVILRSLMRSNDDKDETMEVEHPDKDADELDTSGTVMFESTACQTEEFLEDSLDTSTRSDPIYSVLMNAVDALRQEIATVRHSQSPTVASSSPAVYNRTVAVSPQKRHAIIEQESSPKHRDENACAKKNNEASVQSFEDTVAANPDEINDETLQESTTVESSNKNSDETTILEKECSAELQQMLNDFVDEFE